VKVAKADKLVEKSDFFNLELDVDSNILHGELTILDYVASQHNSTQPKSE
jgi:hypothetical protein